MSRFAVRCDIAARGLILALALSGFMAAVLFAQPGPASPAQSVPPTTQPTAEPSTTQPQAARSATARPEPDNTAAATEEADKSDEEPEPRRQPSPAEILRELTRTGSENKGVVMPETSVRPRRSEAAPVIEHGNAIAPAKPRLLPDGYRLVDRPGRLAQVSDYWVFSFESRGRGTPEMPIRLLPNRLLEDMEEFSAGGTKDIVFVVSGQVTEYRGVNYLLIQKLLTRPSVGNLK